jgi:hypothetical protein
MKKILILFASMLFGCLAAGGDEIAFVDTYGNALKAATEKNQQMLITFYTDG